MTLHPVIPKEHQSIKAQFDEKMASLAVLPI